MSAAPDDDDVIDEFPLDVREFEEALLPFTTRNERRRMWRALRDAKLIVFRE